MTGAATTPNHTLWGGIEQKPTCPLLVPLMENPRTEHGVQNKAEKNQQASVNRKYGEQARGVQKTGTVRAAGT